MYKACLMAEGVFDQKKCCVYVVGISNLQFMLKTVDIRSPKTGISVHYSYSLLMAIQIY